MLVRLIMWLCHIQYKRYKEERYKEDIYYIKGKGKNYPKYLLYTENPSTYNRIDRFQGADMGLFKRLFCLHCYKKADPLKYGSYSSVMYVCKYCGKITLVGELKPWERLE